MQRMEVEDLAKALLAMSRASQSDDLERQIAEQLADTALSLSGYQRAVVLSSGHEQRPTVLVNRGVDETYLAFLLQQYVRLPGMKVLESGQPLVVEDVAHDPAYDAARAQVSAAGIGALVVLPMRALGQELMGSMVLYHAEPRRPGEDTLTVIEALVDHGAMAIANARLVDARRYLLEQTVLEKSQEVVSVLAAGIAHDFNNLLGSLLSLVSLTTTLEPRELKTACRSLEIQVQQAAQLSRNLLELAKPGAGDASLEPIELLPAAREAVAMVRPALQGTTRLVIDPSSETYGEPMAARIDRTAYSRVVLNLLLNALQAVEGHREGRIQVRIFRDGADCVTEVDDNGPGVPAEKEDQIFEPFVSLKKSQGTGVGLPAARGIVERAGGTLTLRHREGAGACFVVRLPATMTTGETLESLSESTDSEMAVAQGGRLLLAEDQPMQRQAFAQSLRKAGFEVDVAADGREALDCLEGVQYDAVLLDHAMPEVTGGTILTFLRAEGNQVPVILISGFGHDPQLHELARDGLTRILSKPFRPELLVHEVRRLLAAD